MKFLDNIQNLLNNVADVVPQCVKVNKSTYVMALLSIMAISMPISCNF